ncbi:PhzF family phenazine biosynthesis protein [Enterovibrio sp. Hal110]
MADVIEVYVVNAFVADNQGGNPAGVVLNAQSLDAAQMQTIAAELGHSGNRVRSFHRKRRIFAFASLPQPKRSTFVDMPPSPLSLRCLKLKK